MSKNLLLLLFLFLDEGTFCLGDFFVCFYCSVELQLVKLLMMAERSFFESTNCKKTFF